MKKVFIVFVFIVGILLSLQARSFKLAHVLGQRSDARTVLSELRVFQVANERLREELSQKEKSLDELRTQISTEAIEDEVKRLQLLSGQETVTGSGLEITFSETIRAFWITDLIAHLVSGGAEAVSFNDVRLIPETAGFRDIGGGIMMRRQFFTKPYKISIIGPTKELREAIAQNGGIIDRIENAYPQLKIIVTESKNVIMQAPDTK